MKNSIIIIGAAFLLTVASVIDTANGDLFDCDEKKLAGLSDLAAGVGLKIDSPEDKGSSEHEVRDFFKRFGCQLKKGADKVGEQAKKLGGELKEGAKKLGAKASDLGSNIKSKFVDFRDKLTKDSVEELTSSFSSGTNHHSLLANVEIIDPDTLKAEQRCGHGHLLDALGNCKKLRK